MIRTECMLLVPTANWRARTKVHTEDGGRSPAGDKAGQGSGRETERRAEQSRAEQSLEAVDTYRESALLLAVRSTPSSTRRE